MRVHNVLGPLSGGEGAAVGGERAMEHQAVMDGWRVRLQSLA